MIRKRDKFLKTRVISAVVLISITLACVFISPVTRVIFFAAAGILCAYELSRNLEKLEVGCAAGVMYVYLAAQAVLTLIDRFTGVEIGLFWYMVLFACAVYFALFAGILRKDVSGKGALGTVFGLAYPCFQFSMIMVICVSDIWLQTLAVACLSTWVCDSFALFGGKRFGKHKIAPSVSPNKTVEGCICGAISSVVTGVIVYYLSQFWLPIPFWLCVVTALLASTMGQIGDLAESLVKRMIGVKDFSNLIPGHGGMFDRADSLLFSIPTAYLCLIVAGMIV